MSTIRLLVLIAVLSLMMGTFIATTYAAEEEGEGDGEVYQKETVTYHKGGD